MYVTNGDGENRTHVRDRAKRWRLRGYPALWSHPEVASPAGLLGTSLLKMFPVWRRRIAPGEPASDPGDPRGRQAGTQSLTA